MGSRNTAPRRGALALLAALLIAPGAAGQIVNGQVVSLGFPSESMGQCMVRTGQWFPIRVKLTLQGSGTATRDLKFESIDLDGDRVSLIRPQVTVSTEGGGSEREVWCYGLINALNEAPQNLVLVDEQGQARERVPLPMPDRLGNDELLIADLSDQQIVSFKRLVAPNWTPGERTDATRDYYRSIAVSRFSAADLPDRWIGLEAVDVLVWDEPRPDDLKRIVQLDAVVEWVRRGGQLIIGLGGSADALADSALAPILPLDPASLTTIELTDLPVFRERVSPGATAAERRPARPVIAAIGALTPDAVRTLGEFGGPRGSLDLIAMRLVGSGRVATTAVPLRELAALSSNDERFVGALIDLNRYTAKFKERQGQLLVQAIGERFVYDDVVEPIGFGTATAARGALALLFVAAYILLATLVVWWRLARLKRTALSWTVFAATAILASGASLGAVGLTRGCSSGVQSLAILDLESGQTSAHGYCYFGYRSPTRSRDDLALPGKGQFLRPLARSPRGRSFYVTPDRYVGQPLEASLGDVLLRATLKQFEGAWQGELGGTLRGQLAVDRRTGQISASSFVVNELDLPIDGGYLFFSDPRQEDNGVPRPAGRTTLYDEPNLPPVPPAVNVLAVSIGALDPGERVAQLGAAMYARVGQDRDRWAQAPNRQRAAMPDLRTLYDEQNVWRGNVLLAAPPPRAAAGALLASLRNYHLHGRGQNYEATIDAPVSTEGLLNLDISHWLLSGRAGDGRTAGYAVLIAWSARPGPARLSVNGAAQEAFGGLTVFRVRIPLEYAGSPPEKAGGGAAAP